MGFSLSKISSAVSTVSSAVNIASTLSNIDVSSINVSNLGSIKSTIQSALNGQTDTIMSQLQSSIVPGDIESMVSGFDIEKKGAELVSQLQVPSMDGGIDQSAIDSQVNDIINKINSEVSSSMDFSSIKFM